NANANANANANCPAIATTHNPYEWHWLLARHRDRNTWEIPGGRIEPGESPRDCAQRELYEETGVQTQWLDPAFDYCVHNNGVYSVGQVYLADVTISGTDTTATLPAIPPNSEMIETRLFPTLPPADALTYPHIQPVLNKAFQDWLALNTPDEYRDLYDADRNPLGILHRRGTPLLPNTYNTVVRAWLVNDTGQILITQRALTKLGGPGLWEVPTGSATAGETGQLSARRELAEEAGITVPPECGEIFFTQRKDWAFWDNWLFRHNYNLADVVLQAGETINTRAATVEEIREMIKKGTFIPQVADELEHLAVVIKAQ
ncbi:MAG: NUDIX domain-containing protein, partial [Defluviitaleaceae bacterium]|nr:NUDIX domain-containing protein [Defluviitaleaceae bacterium]